MKKFTISCCFAGFAALAGSSAAVAAPKLRVQVDQKGDFVLIGNTLGHDCRTLVPAPVVGTVGACGNNTADSAPDVYWRADAPGAGQAAANNTVTMAQARSTAVLGLKTGAQVTHAYLYWGARPNRHRRGHQRHRGAPRRLQHSSHGRRELHRRCGRRPDLLPVRRGRDRHGQDQRIGCVPRLGGRRSLVHQPEPERQLRGLVHGRALRARERAAAQPRGLRRARFGHGGDRPERVDLGLLGAHRRLRREARRDDLRGGSRLDR